MAESPSPPIVVALLGMPLVGANGVRITPDTSFDACPRPDVVCITDLAIAPTEALDERYDAAARWIRECHAAGSLIARHAGAEAAMQVARINLFDWSSTSPIAYASLTHGSQAADPVIGRCQQWAAMNYQAESPVAQMVTLSGLHEAQSPIGKVPAR